MVALAPTTKIMIGVAFQPLVVILLMSGWYFVVFSFKSPCSKSITAICKFYGLYTIMSFGVGVVGGERLYGWHMTQRMSGLNLALQWHLLAPQVHGSNHVGTMFS